jgi:hypothetical protein
MAFGIFRQRKRGLIMIQLVHLGYDLVSGIIIIWIPNQDNGIFGKRQFKLFIKDTGLSMG